MYTSAHILVHFQNINGKDYVRIISVSNTDSYIQELKIAYGQDIDKQDDNIHIFYNCGDLYNRLINDLEFKKFKDVQIVSKSKGLWQIKSNIAPWVTFFKTYISWIRARFNMYIEDLDETYFNLHTIKWCEVEIQKHVKVEYDLECTNYILKNCETTKDGKFIFTRDHFASLVTYYINCRHKNVWIKDVEPIYIVNCELRGFYLERNTFSVADAKQILDKLGIDEVDLQIVEKNADFISIWDKEFASQINDLCEYNPFGGRYSFLDGSKEPKLDDFFTLILGTTYDEFPRLQKSSMATSNANEVPSKLKETTSKAIQDAMNLFNSQCEKSSTDVNETQPVEVPSTSSKALQDAISLLYSQCEKSSTIVNEPGIDLPRVTDKELQLFSSDATDGFVCNVKPISKVEEDPLEYHQNTKHLYKNSITKIVCAFNSKLKLLNEFVSLDMFTFYQPFTEKVLESLGEISKSKLVIEELKTLIAILDKSVDPNEDDASGSNKQKTLTEQYVKINKNDNVETQASIATDNVFSYLSLMQSEQINKNQIGKDLVDLGVKKTRKAKGFVYGLSDSMHRIQLPVAREPL